MKQIKTEKKMPIQIVPERGKNVPLIFCDHCGKVIKKATAGMVVFEMKTRKTDRSDVYFAHKGTCLREFEQDNFVSSQTIGTTPLQTFPVYLGNVLGINWEDAKATAELLSL